jgi:AcrR family transcriptional regulator
MRRPRLKNLKFPNEATSKAEAAREAIVDAAQRLFLGLGRGFGAVSMCFGVEDSPQ